MTTNHRIEAYRELAFEHGVLMRKQGPGVSERMAQVYSGLMKALNELIDSQEDEQLKVLYNDPDSWVRLWSASHTLELGELQALSVLQALEKDPDGSVRLTAWGVIREWKAGKMRFRKRS